MKLDPKHRKKRAFTLVELLVAMAITVLIVTVLVSITAIAMDTWNRSRSELRASRQAKAMIEALSNDFESIVAWSGNSFEWMVAESISEANLPGDSLKSTNAARLVLLTAVQDRYNGALSSQNARGDVSGVGYLLDFSNPISGGSNEFSTFVLKRHLVNPDAAFEFLLGQENLMTAFNGQYANALEAANSFVCENVYQFTATFQVEVVIPTTTYVIPVPVSANGVSDFRLSGGGINFTGSPSGLPRGVTDDDLRSGRLIGVDFSLTVLTDRAANRIRRGAFPTDPDLLNEFLTENSFNYSRFIPLTSL